MEKKVCKNKAGFTLIEMLVVLGITGILSSVGLISYQSAKSEAALRAAQREVATVIRMAQSYALQGKIQTIDGEQRTPCGYGFEFTNDHTYRIFYTYKNDPSDAKNTCENDREYPSTGSIVSINGNDQIFQLPDNVTMTNAPVLPTKFYFTIPFGSVFPYDSVSDFGGNEMTLEYGENNATKRIIVNERGDVEEAD